MLANGPYSDQETISLEYESLNMLPMISYLTHYSQVLLFYTPWKLKRFSEVFRRYRKAKPGCKGLKGPWTWKQQKESPKTQKRQKPSKRRIFVMIFDMLILKCLNNFYLLKIFAYDKSILCLFCFGKGN